MTIEVTPTLSMSPQITNVINQSRTPDTCYNVLDGFMRLLHFRKHHWYVDGANSIKMHVNDGTNDNTEDGDTTVVDTGGVSVFLPTTLLFSQYFTTSTPNDFIVNTSYVNEISKIVSLDQSLMNLIFTFSSTPTVDGTEYTLGNLVLNVISGDDDLSGSVLTVTPDSNDNICVTVSIGDYTDTFNGEAFGFNTMVSGKYMPKVTTLKGSNSHLVLKFKWLKSDLTTYTEDWVVLQNIGDAPTSGSFYLTAWQERDTQTILNIGIEGYHSPELVNRMYDVTYGFFRISKSLHHHAMTINYSAWSRTQDYTNDPVGHTSSFSSVPLQSWLLMYENDIFLVYQAQARLSNNTQLLDTYTHMHGTLNKRVVETTLCRKRTLEAVTYQDNGNTCGWSVAGVLGLHGWGDDPARLNTAGSWADEAMGTVWTRSTGDYRGVGVHNNTAGQEGSNCMAFINYSSNLSFDFEECERGSAGDTIEFLIEPILPNILYVDDYVDHTHLTITGTEADYGVPLETLIGTIGSPTTYAYTNGALALDAVLGGNHYNTPLRYILAYDNGYHIVDTLAEPFKFANQVISD